MRAAGEIIVAMLCVVALCGCYSYVDYAACDGAGRAYMSCANPCLGLPYAFIYDIRNGGAE